MDVTNGTEPNFSNLCPTGTQQLPPPSRPALRSARCRSSRSSSSTLELRVPFQSAAAAGLQLPPASMSCSDERLASLLLKLAASRQVASIVGEALDRKLQPWLSSAQKCEDMLRCRSAHLHCRFSFHSSQRCRGRFAEASPSELCHGDVLVVKRALCR